MKNFTIKLMLVILFGLALAINIKSLHKISK